MATLASQADQCKPATHSVCVGSRRKKSRGPVYLTGTQRRDASYPRPVEFYRVLATPMAVSRRPSLFSAQGHISLRPAAIKWRCH
jgi:hypothetical protein